MGCKETVLPDPLLKNHSVKCGIYEKNNRKPYNDKLCLVRALALHLRGKEGLESKISKSINVFLQKTGGINHAIFRGFCTEDIAGVEDIV